MIEDRAPFDRIEDDELRELIDMGIVLESTKMIDGREQTVYELNPKYADEIREHYEEDG